MAKKAKKKKAAPKAKSAKSKPKKKSAPKAAAKSKPKSPEVPGQRLLNFKVFDTEYETMKKLAKKHAGGNLSAWVRFATVNAKPTSAQQKRFDAKDY